MYKIALAIAFAVCLASSFYFPFHFAVEQPPGFFLLSIYNLISLAFLFIFLLTSYGIGEFFNKKFFACDVNKQENFLVSFTLGTGFLILIALVLGTIGFLTPILLKILFSILFTFSLTQINFSFPYFNFSKILSAVFLLLIFGELIFCLTPTLDWDDASHHINLAKVFLNDSGIGSYYFAPPFNFQANAQLIYSYFLAFHIEAGPRLVNLAYTVILVFGTFVFAKKFTSTKAAILAAVLLLSANIIWEVGTTGRVENIFSLFSLLTFLFTYLALEKENYRLLCLACLAAGVAIGTKLLAIFILVFPLIAIFILLLRKAKYAVLLFSLLLLLAPSAYWYVKNYVNFGHVFYPVSIENFQVGRAKPFLSLDNIKQDRYLVLDKHIEGKEEANLSKILSPQFKKLGQTIHDFENTYQKSSFFNLYDFLFDQDQFTRKEFHYLNPLIFLGILLPFFWWKNKFLNLMLLNSVFYFLIIASFLGILRYLIPITPFLSLLTAISLYSVYEKFIKNKSLQSFVYIVTLLVLFLLPLSNIRKKLNSNYCDYVMGNSSQYDFLEKKGYNNAKTGFIPILKYLNQNPPAKVLMVGESKGFLLKSEYLGDYEQLGRYANSWSYYLAKSEFNHQKLLSMLKEDGFSHMLVSWNYFFWVMNKNEVNNIERLKFLLIDLIYFIENFGKIEAQSGGYWMVKI